MPTLNTAQLATLARQAGWTGDDVVTAVAVALAESGGRTDARGDVGLQDNTWGPSIGLWQMRSLKSAKGTGGMRDELANLDAATNARHAHELFASSGWQPWSTFNNGAYKKHLTAARAGAAASTAPAPVEAAGGGYEAVTVVRWRQPVPWNSTLSGIASRYGWGGNWQAVWNDSHNTELRSRRGSPDKIQPGDVVHVRHK